MIQNINKGLKNLYGLTPNGKAKFRVIWSNGVTEKRVIHNGLYKEVKEVLKYSYVRDRYILEGFNQSWHQNPEILLSDDYEPLFVFDKKGVYLKPELWACEFFINTMMNGRPNRGNDKTALLEDQEKVNRNAQAYFDFLNAEEN